MKNLHAQISFEFCKTPAFQPPFRVVKPCSRAINFCTWCAPILRPGLICFVHLAHFVCTCALSRLLSISHASARFVYFLVWPWFGLENTLLQVPTVPGPPRSRAIGVSSTPPPLPQKLSRLVSASRRSRCSKNLTPASTRCSKKWTPSLTRSSKRRTQKIDAQFKERSDFQDRRPDRQAWSTRLQLSDKMTK